MNRKRAHHSLTRRDFIQMLSLGGGMVLLSACGGNKAASTPSSSAASQKSPEQLQFQSPPTAAPTQQAAQTSPSTAVATQAGKPQANSTAAPAPTLATPKSFKESPKLAAQVKAGKLPKVEERLPSSPLVLQPVERAGDYGGDLHTPILGSSGFIELERVVGFDAMVRWKPDTKQYAASEVIPNIAESFQVNEKGTEYTFKLREGMKWSDGKPYTADDILFWYEDVQMNKDISPVVPDWLQAGGKPVKVEKTDDYTVVFKFAAPNGLLLQRLASPAGNGVTYYPAHYLKQFHKKYNKNVEQDAKKAKMDNWVALFGQKADAYGNKDRPVTDAWKFTKPLGEGTQQLIAESNPYYWKVDTEGNQLPYTDRIVSDIIEKAQVMLLKALNGEIDFVYIRINTPQNKPLFYKNQDRGKYHFFELRQSWMNSMAFCVNLTHQDKVKRKVFSDKNFRIGLSHAINRQEIINVNYQSQGKPYQLAPRPESKFYNEKLAKQYTEYDVKKANEYLDKVMPKKDSKGRRLGPDGKPFSFNIEFDPDFGAQWSWADVLEMMKKYWADVGIDVTLKPEERSLFYTRKAGNLIDAGMWVGSGGLECMLDPRWYFPYSAESVYAVPWAIWFANPKAEGAIKPPAAPRKQMKLYNEMIGTVDTEKQDSLMKQILDISADQFYCIGISLLPNDYGVVKNDFHNVPKSMLEAWEYTYPAPTNPCQYFFEQK